MKAKYNFIKRYDEICLGKLADAGLRVTETDKYGAFLHCDCAMCHALRVA